MAEPTENPVEAFAPTREHEYQDPHYHDEEPDIVNDEEMPHASIPRVNRKKSTRRPPPRPHYYED